MTRHDRPALPCAGLALAMLLTHAPAASAQCGAHVLTNITDPAGYRLDEPPSWHNPPATPGGCTTCGGAAGDLGPARSVYLFSGEVYETAVDMVIRGRGFDFTWSRKYRSRDGLNTSQGNGWDFSYNLFIDTCAANFIVHDGNSRADLFSAQPDSTWARDGFFRVLSDPPGSGRTLTFPDTGVWNFLPIAGPTAGKIESIVDRNGNTMRFEYDGLGRLVGIRDTLDSPSNSRLVTIAYNADGFIQSVTDYTGRQVVYEYYSNADVGGSFGDLKSARSPVVTGTPNQNNFPQGKKITYTYSEGFADERLNHNLLTVKDAKNQVFLQNIYSTETNPANINFDRVVRQIWGGAGETVDLAYAAQTPGPGNGNAVVKAIVADRARNVSEYSYDSLNRLTLRRRFTGRCAAGPVTESSNRPTGKLRPADPDFFETRWQYNADSLPTLVTAPNGNSTVSVYEADVNPAAARRSRGNLLSVTRNPGPLGGDQAFIVESFEYALDMGGCCGTNFVTRHVDGRGNETLHTYDTRGNRTHTQHRAGGGVEDWTYDAFGQVLTHTLPANGSLHRRVDATTYHSAGVQAGYPATTVMDSGGLNLTATFAYDSLGRTTSQIDPRGFVTTTQYNQLGQVVRVVSPEDSPGSGNTHQTLYWYDANNNVVRVDTENRNENGVLSPNPFITTVYEYDTLDRHTRTFQERAAVNTLANNVPVSSPIPAADVSKFIRTRTVYDANGNVSEGRSGVAENGQQAGNITRYVYDERDLRFQTQRAPGVMMVQTTTQEDYDGNGNLVREQRGLEADDPGQPGDGIIRTTTYTYDGYDRLKTTADPMGNVTTYTYDANGSRLSERADGQLTDTPGGGGNVRLRQTTYTYDSMDRLSQRNEAYFNVQNQANIGDGQRTTTYAYDNIGRVTSVTNDRGFATQSFYDDANRLSRTVDPEGNEARYTYDATGNMVELTTIEKSDLGNPDQTFRTTYAYDGIGRNTSVTDNIGNVARFEYDSRNNRVSSIDPRGVETRYSYDGAGRQLSQAVDMDGDGALDADPADIVTTTAYDDDGRIRSNTDDNGNATEDMYDARDCPMSTDYADCSFDGRSYDVHGNLLSETQPNGVRSTYQYDAFNRTTRRDIDCDPSHPGCPLNGQTFETFAYDGLGRVVRAQNDDALVTRSYDSLGNMRSETVNGRTVSYTYDAVGNVRTMTYPGGRVISTTYDRGNEKRRITENNDAGPLITEYSYAGPGRTERRTHGNGTAQDYLYDGLTPGGNAPGDMGVKRVVETRHFRTGDNSVIDRRGYKWDAAGDKTERRDLRASGLTHRYTYDGDGRLARATVTNPSSAILRDSAYTLDGSGNRLSVAGVGTLCPGVYSMTAGCPDGADFEMNQYTLTPCGRHEYDDNGNETTVDDSPESTCGCDWNRDNVLDSQDFFDFIEDFFAGDADFNGFDGTDSQDFFDFLECFFSGCPELGGLRSGTRRDFLYDASNRIVGVVSDDGVTPTTTLYKYDPFGRRIARIDDAGGPSQDETRYFYSGWQAIEEQSAAGVTRATYVFGAGPDEVLSMTRGANTYYYHQDDMGNVMALTNQAGTSVERYEYDDYGAPVDPSTLAAVAGSPSSVGNPLLFAGRPLDSESGLYDFRTRAFNPQEGRFTARDTIGIWGDGASHGNAYTFAANNPWSLSDPMGTDPNDDLRKFFERAGEGRGKFASEAERTRVLETAKKEGFPATIKADRWDCTWTKAVRCDQTGFTSKDFDTTGLRKQAFFESYTEFSTAVKSSIAVVGNYGLKTPLLDLQIQIKHEFEAQTKFGRKSGEKIFVNYVEVSFTGSWTETCTTTYERECMETRKKINPLARQSTIQCHRPVQESLTEIFFEYVESVVVGKTTEKKTARQSYWEVDKPQVPEHLRGK